MPDSSIFQPNAFPNQLGLLKVTDEDILCQIRGYSLHFFKEYNEEVEHNMEFPLFVRAFYNFIYKKQRIPTQEEFYKYYLSSNHDYFSANHFSGLIYLGLQARAYRSYPSLVRDLYFNKLLEKNNDGYEIVYNIHLDLERDIDTLLIKNNRYWAACLYTKTDKGEKARVWKKNRHFRFDNVSYIEFPVEFNEERKVGDFFLYGEPEVSELFSRINHIHISKRRS